MKTPRDPNDTLGGLVYFPRMLDKIRLKQRGELSDYYFDFLAKGFDGRLCQYLGIEYTDVVNKVEAGASDDEIQAWTQETGMKLNPDRIDVWNGFSIKRGCNDNGSETLRGFKEERGFADRDDITTFFEFIVADEKPE